MELTAWALTFIGMILGVYAIVISVKIFNKQESLQEGLKNIEREKLAYEKNKNKQDLAVEILKYFFDVKNSIAKVRDPFVGISQLGCPGLSKHIDINKTIEMLNTIATEMGLSYFLMNAGDHDKNVSFVISANNETTELLRDHFNLPFENGYQEFDRMLFRKTDFLF